MNKILHKLFLSFSAFILLLLVGIFFFQNYFLQSFYFDRKLNLISKNMDEFVSDYVEEEWGGNELEYKVSEFFLDNNATAYMSDSYGSFGNSLVLEGEDDDDNIWFVLVEEADFVSLVSVSDIEPGAVYYFEGIVSEENSDFIIADFIDPDILYENIDMDEESDLFKSQLTIKDIMTMDEAVADSWTEMEMVGKGQGVDGLQEKTYLNESTYYTTSYDPFYSTSYVNLVKEFEKDGEKREFYVDLNIQSVDEMTDILRHYYMYFLLIAVVLAFVFVMFFSTFISRPLVKMSRVANRMAKMDFGEKITYESSDELGSLAKDLNIMSDSLSSKISQLNDANARLEDEIIRERKREAIRKEFVANVSHELKTPLGVIKSYSEAIKDGIKKDKHGYYLDVIVDEVESMNKLVMFMLELSKVEAGDQTLNIEEFDIYGLAGKVWKSFELECENKRLNFMSKGDRTLVRGDSEKMERVLVNLFSNAVRYSNKGTTVSLEIEKNEDRCICRISNSSRPMSDDEMENIWNRFFKGDKSHNRELGGTGLGLAIVKAILEGHGSNYGVDQEDGKLVFHFDLELA